MTAPDSDRPPLGLTSLVVSVTKKPRHLWPKLTDRASVLSAIEAGVDDQRELRVLAACYPNPALRALRLRRLAEAFAVPDALVVTLIARLDALPPLKQPPLAPEIGDWAWERRKELFGRW